MIGERILNYQVESIIGEGGMGKVYLATHTQLGRKVAIKVLNPELVNHTDIKERFRNEAATLSGLQHVNIVTLYDYLEDERGLFLIMEYVEGKPLDQYIKTVSGPIPEKKAIDFFSQLLDGLQYAHSKNIIHRDLKPSNIIINKEEKIKILDFGIAKLLSEGNAGITKVGEQLGTVLYMSPEQVEGKLSDYRTDIYSLGATLFEMLTGKPPYNESTLSTYEIYTKIIKEPLPRLKDFYPAASDKMQTIIDKATAKNSEDRFQDCNSFKEALLAEQPVLNTKTETIQNTNKENPVQEKRTQASKKEVAPKKGFPVFASVIILILLIVVFWMWNNSGGKKAKEDNKISKADTTKKSVLAEDAKDKKKEDKKKEEKSPREELRDSLQKNKKELEDKLKELGKKREKEIMQNLVVDGQFEDNQGGEFIIQVTLVNLKDDAKFEDVVIAISYFSSKGKELETYEYTYANLGPKESNTFQVKRTVEAAKFTCKIKSAKFTDLKASDEDKDQKPEEVVKIEKELKKINDQLKKMEEEDKEKEQKK